MFNIARLRSVTMGIPAALTTVKSGSLLHTLVVLMGNFKDNFISVPFF